VPGFFLPAGLIAMIAGAGLVQAIVGYLAVRRFRATPHSRAHNLPPVSVLKPLCGDEPQLETALASVCAQDYPSYQVVLGVQRPDDGALAVVERLRSRFPSRDIVVVVDTTTHGNNRKVGNLINMFPAARHNLLVIADSDVHAARDYLERIVCDLAEPGTGLVTALYAGLAANRSLAARLGATALTHSFLPGVLLARQLGRQDCLGPTMALRRETLSAIGGLTALSEHVADDHVLGELVLRQGLGIRLASTVCATSVAETTLSDLVRHELRWARTIRAMVPIQFALSSIQYPLFWATLTLVLSGFALWAAWLFLAVWAGRALVARAIDRSLDLSAAGLATPAPIWLLPLRDLMSVLVLLAGFAGNRVEWRGEVIQIETRPVLRSARRSPMHQEDDSQ
jgi:ceramide glucosyltransferase